MATLYIREYTTLAAGVHDTSGPASGSGILQEPGVNDQAVTFDAEGAVSLPFGQGTRYVTLIADAPFAYVVGEDPAAVAGVNLIAPANTLLSFGVQPGNRIAVIAAPAPGAQETRQQEANHGRQRHREPR